MKLFLTLINLLRNNPKSPNRRFWHYFTVAKYRITAQIDMFDSYASIAYAFCSPNDNFSKARGRDLAGKSRFTISVGGPFGLSGGPDIIDVVRNPRNLLLLPNLPHNVRAACKEAIQ